MIRIRHSVLLAALLAALLVVLAPVPASFAGQHLTLLNVPSVPLPLRVASVLPATTEGG